MTGFRRCAREDTEDSVGVIQGTEWRDVKFLPTALINSFQVNSVCDLRISIQKSKVDTYPASYNTENNRTVIFTHARKIIYIRISFVRLHLAVMSVISKEQEGFYFPHRHWKIVCKEDTNSVAQQLLKGCRFKRADNKTIRTASFPNLSPRFGDVKLLPVKKTIALLLLEMNCREVLIAPFVTYFFGDVRVSSFICSSSRQGSNHQQLTHLPNHERCTCTFRAELP
jgi:hypothetical protein